MDPNVVFKICDRFKKMIQLEKFEEIMGRQISGIEFTEEPSTAIAIKVEKELFKLQKQKAEIIKRQSQLVHILEDMWLEEQTGKIKAELHDLLSHPECDQGPDDMEKITLLNQILVSLVEQRDRMIADLDVERNWEKEDADKLQLELQRQMSEWSEHQKRGKAAIDNPPPVYRSLADLISSEHGRRKQKRDSIDEL